VSVTPGQAVYEAQNAAIRRRFPGIAEIWWGELSAEAQAEQEDIARDGIAAYIEANGGDPAGARSVIAGEGRARLLLAGERDEARSDFSRLRAALLEGGQSDTAVRKRCLAILATAGTVPVDAPPDLAGPPS
jgi:hypothetical protein